jgi:hypothetical protein
MRKCWSRFFRRIASVCFVCGATAWSSAMCYAQIAADNASDPVYANGWQAGDNGGFGFGPWNFTGTYDTAVGQAIDNGLGAGGTGSAPFNNIGRAWTLFGANAPNDLGPAGPVGDGPDNPPSGGSDIAQAGRAIVGNLPIGATISVQVDNPLERKFFRGYTVRFNTGAGNTTFMGAAQSRLAVGTFEYFTNGKWFATGTGGDPTVFDTDTDAGMRIDLTLTGVNTFNLVMTPLDNPGAAFSKAGTLDGPAGTPIDWVEFEIYNTDSDFYPTAVPQAAAPAATDFYMSSMTIVPEPQTALLLLFGCGGVLVAAARKRHDRPRSGP